MTVTDAPAAPADTPTEPPGTAVEVAFPAGAQLMPDVPDRNRWAEIETVAKRLARSSLVPPKFRMERVQGQGQVARPLEQVESDLVMVGLYAHDLGLTFTTAMTHINVIEGVPSLSAQAQLGIVRARGHKVSAVEHKDEKGRTTGFSLHSVRGDTGETLDVSFMLRDAVAKGLCTIDDSMPNGVRARKYDKPTPWEVHTADMLWARAVTTLTRRGFSDVLSGMTFTAEELAPQTVWVETADENDRQREPLSDDQRLALNARWGSLTPEARRSATETMNEAAALGTFPLRMSDIGAAHFDAAIGIMDAAAAAPPPAPADDGVADAEIVEHGNETTAETETTPAAEPADETPSEALVRTGVLGDGDDESPATADPPAQQLCDGCGTPLGPNDTPPYCAPCGDPM